MSYGPSMIHYENCKAEVRRLEDAIKEKDSALFYANQRLETIEMFSNGELESQATRKRIEMALKLGEKNAGAD